MANSKNKKQSSTRHVGKSKTKTSGKAQTASNKNIASNRPREEDGTSDHLAHKKDNLADNHAHKQGSNIQTISQNNTSLKSGQSASKSTTGQAANSQTHSQQTNQAAGQQAKQQSQGKTAQKEAKEVKVDDSQSAKIKPANPQESEQNNAEKLDDSKNPQNKQPPKHHWWLDAIYFIGGTLALGGIASLLGGKMFDFGGYNLPPATAPAWLFPIMWALIYIAIGVATFCMWRDKQISSKDRKINLILYFIHMAFNITWPLWFFMLSQPIVACVWLAIIIVLALITTWRYFVANLASGIIFCVYVLWLIYAFYLNLGVCLLL